jgi:hypothetical protein
MNMDTKASVAVLVGARVREILRRIGAVGSDGHIRPVKLGLCPLDKGQIPPVLVVRSHCVAGEVEVLSGFLKINRESELAVTVGAVA